MNLRRLHVLGPGSASPLRRDSAAKVSAGYRYAGWKRVVPLRDEFKGADLFLADCQALNKVRAHLVATAGRIGNANFACL